jgi:hypothetical protein
MSWSGQSIELGPLRGPLRFFEAVFKVFLHRALHEGQIWTPILPFECPRATKRVSHGVFYGSSHAGGLTNVIRQTDWMGRPTVEFRRLGSGF